MEAKVKEKGTKYPLLKEVDNFRDLGGIPVADGRVVNHNTIFRSGALFDLTSEQQQTLDNLHIGHIFDLRSPDEVEYKPDYVPNGAKYHAIPAVKTRRSLVIKPDSVVDMIPTWLPTRTVRWIMKTHFKSLYRRFPFNNKAYKAMFEVMDTGSSFLFHCSAGKDRTGVASMLILLALGADMEHIRHDYMLSNYYRLEVNEQFNSQFAHLKNYDKLVSIFNVAATVNMEYFDQAYKKIIRKYGTVQNFLQKQYGIDQQRIQRWLHLYTHCPTKNQ